MTLLYVVVLAVVSVAVLAVRFVTPALPVRRFAVGLGAVNSVVLFVALLALAFHCGAMFYTDTVGSIPGTKAAVDTINALGTSSMIAYAIPAALIVVALRRVPLPVLAAVALALTAVGVTMYDGGPLDAHLTAIFVTVVLLAVVVSLLLSPKGSADARATSGHRTA